MDTQDLKRVTLLDILCLFYGVLLGFYAGICKQCNYEQKLQCTTQGNGLSNSEAKHINYDRSELLRWAKHMKLTGFSNEDIKRIKLLNLRQSFRGKKELKEQNVILIEVFIMHYCVPYLKTKYSMKTLNY